MEEYMQYTIEKKDSKIMVSFTIDSQEWETAINIAYNKTKGNYNIQGFRKGHVPRKVIEGMYGAGVFIEDAFNNSFSKWYVDMLEKEPSINPVDRPEVDLTDVNDKGITFTTLITVKPEIILGNYKGIKIPLDKIEITEEQIDQEVNKIADRNSRMVDVSDRAVINGDSLTIDYSGSVNGEKFEGGTAQMQTLVIGSNTFIPGFEPQLIGMNKGETKDIDVKFPDDYQAENLKGANAVFTVTVHEIKSKEMPKIDDEFAKDVSEFNTLDEYKASIRSRLFTEAASRAEQVAENKLIEAICKNVDVEIPQPMVERQIDNMIEEFEYSLKYQGLKLDDYLKYTKQTKEAMRKVYQERAVNAVKTRLVIEAIISAENIQPSAEKIEEKIAEYAVQSNVELDKFKASLTSDQINYINNEVVTYAAIEYIKSVNIIK